MLTTVQAIIDHRGQVQLLEKIKITKPTRVLVTILDEDFAMNEQNITALLSEQALAVDWNRPEEDEAWAHLQQAK